MFKEVQTDLLCDGYILPTQKVNELLPQTVERILCTQFIESGVPLLNLNLYMIWCSKPTLKLSSIPSTVSYNSERRSPLIVQ